MKYNKFLERLQKVSNDMWNKPPEQFTIDIMELVEDELFDLSDIDDDTLYTLLGSIKYEIETSLEIFNPNLSKDICFLQEISVTLCDWMEYIKPINN